ncbi:hypothetical protein [Roseivirga sp. 4D4]|uniref:hypothetical protein n=1 Tax=Roseivirga sp. 4D4 TaxID=1889784 RepID=UPI001112FA77|nr:hypothetical protein [Roseivirga sp. 4D4]
MKLLIPETASIALQLENPQKTLITLEELGWYKAYRSIPLIERLQLGIEKIDSLESTGALSSQISKLPLWISLHTTSSDDLSALFMLKSSGFDWTPDNLKTLLGKLLSRDVDLSNQQFDGKEILTFQSQEFSVSALIEGEYLAFSKNAVLVEDVVRAIQEPESRLLKETEGFGSTGDLNIVVNSSRLSELSAVFFESFTSFQFDTPTDGNLIVDVDFKNDGLAFRGNGQNFSRQGKPASIFAENLIPITSNTFFWKPIEINSDPWQNLFKGDLCSIEIDKGGRVTSKVFVFSVTDTTNLRNVMDRLAEENLSEKDSMIYKERFVNSDIGFIDNSQLLNELLSNNTTTFKSPYYTVNQGFLIMSDDNDALKMVLNDFENESTWGRSVDRRRTIDEMIQETDLTLVRDFEFAADPLRNRLKPKWKSFVEKSPEILSVLNVLMLQFNRTNKNVLVAGDLSFNTVFERLEDDVNTKEDLVVKANVFGDADLTSKAHVVRNHNDGSLEVLFQDADQQLYLANKQGEVLWKRDVDGALSGEIHQIDFYNNKKLQYLFFTDSLIHLVDRNGDNVSGFPVNYDQGLPIDGTAIIDYDNNKRYRYLTKDRRGNLYLYNKEGLPLEGWQPKSIGSDLLQIPFHTRVRGRDCFVVVETTGRIHLLNRRGEEYEGFPVNIDKRFSGKVAFTKGANFDQSLISVSTVDGELIQVDLNGRLVNRNQLLRASGSEFSLVDDALKTTFSIVRNDGRVLALFDKNGDERFSLNFPNSRSIAVDQYNFRNGKEVFAVRDLKEKVFRLVDREGRFLTSLIPASQPVSILFYQNRLEYEVFVNFADQLNIYAIKPL